MINKKNAVLVCRFCHYSLTETMRIPVPNSQADPTTYFVCAHCKRIFDPDPKCKHDYQQAGYEIYALRLPDKKRTKKIA